MNDNTRLLAMYPRLTFKDIHRHNNKLLVLVPELDGGSTPLTSKSMTKEAGQKLLNLGNQQIDSLNHALALKASWIALLKETGGFDPAPKAAYSGRKIWQNYGLLNGTTTDENSHLVGIIKSIEDAYASNESTNDVVFMSNFKQLTKRQKLKTVAFLHLICSN